MKSIRDAVDSYDDWLRGLTQQQLDEEKYLITTRLERATDYRNYIALKTKIELLNFHLGGIRDDGTREY